MRGHRELHFREVILSGTASRRCGRSSRGRYPFLSERTAARLVHSYGTLATDMLGDARDARSLGCDFGAGLTEREVEWLCRTEWARTAEDILWRRSKLGLRFSSGEVDWLSEWLGSMAVSG